MGETHTNIDGEEDQMNIDKQDEQDRQQVVGASLYGAPSLYGALSSRTETLINRMNRIGNK
jgi:hypothetical protein